MDERKFFRAMSFAGLTLAIFVRVFALADKPFWQDEAWVVLLARQPLADLLATRAPIPLGFALAVKAASLLPGPLEVTLRLLPLLAGVATVLLLPLLAGALGANPRTQVVTLWVAAGTPALVNYSRELKHYGMDVLFGVVFALLAIRLFEGRDGASPYPGRGGNGLGWLAAAVPWFSFAAAFPVSATLIWGWCRRWRSAADDVRRCWAKASTAFLLSCAVAYVLFIRHQAANTRLRFFWGRSLHGLEGLPVPLGIAKASGLIIVRSAKFLFPWIWPAAIALAVIGAIWRPRPARSFLLWWIGVTILLAAAAGASGRYVISGRLLLFAAPLLIFPAAIGLEEAGRMLRLPRLLPLFLVLALSGFWCFQAVEHRLHPGGKAGFLYDRQPQLKEMIATVVSHRGPGDPVYVTRRLVAPFGVYVQGRLPDATFEPLPPTGIRLAGNGAPLRRWVQAVGERGWVLLSPRDQRRVRGALREAGWEAHGHAAGRGVLLWRVTRGSGGCVAPGKGASSEKN